MTSTPSQILRLNLMGTGDQVGTWGDTTNVNLGTLLEGAIAGLASVSVTSANQALITTDYVADQARMAILSLSTTTGANFNVYAPPVSKTYVISNTSAYTATIYNSTAVGGTTAAGSGVAVPAGKIVQVWSNGTNFYKSDTALVSLTTDVTGTLPVANGGTGQTTAQAALNALAASTSSGQYLRGNGSNVVMSAIQAGDVPTLNQNTTGSAGSVANAVTFTSSGGAAAGTTFNGSAARTVDYSTVGAPSTSGTGASGTWGISISGNAATASNGGVTSVNGQTGAVTQTSVDSIGSYVVALYAVTHPGSGISSKPLNVGDTTAGSNLRYNFSTWLNGSNDFTGYYISSPSSATYGGGGTALSGTWRCMGRPSFSWDNDLGYVWNPGLFVRVS